MHLYIKSDQKMNRPKTYFAKWFFVLGVPLTLLSTCAAAFTAIPPDRFGFSIGVAPRISALGSPRSLLANGCTGPVSLDESAVASTGNLVMRMAPESIGCVERTVVLSYTPRSVGTLSVTMKKPDGTIVAEAQMETISAARSTVNLDGMWFDPATNGSGISFHHAAGNDVVFGTWFLYGSPTLQQPRPPPRWYSLQNLRWAQNGTLLVGIAYDGRANNVNPSCVSGDDCPRPAVELRTVGSVSVSVIDPNNLRIEAFDQYGRTAFVSLLKRL